MKLLNVDTISEVREKLNSYFPKHMWLSEDIPLRQAVGRYLAKAIVSDLDLPQFRRSVVDGYAVMAKDTFGVSESVPVFLDVTGAVEMGQSCDLALQPGQAIYVPTGGMIPAGADAMVMVEYVEKLDDKTVAVYKPAAPNGGLMNQGDDVQKGQTLYEVGQRITKKDIGMLAAMGCAEVAVFCKPVISILSTGDEIIEIAKEPKIGEIRDINSYALAAFAEQAGMQIGEIAIVKDDPEELTRALANCLEKSDVVLLSGGSSAGTKDVTADIIAALGEPGVITHGLAMKPGKPTIVGVINGKLAVGLPGHPMAAILVYHVVIDPFLRSFYFHNEEEAMAIEAVITENLHAGEGRETFQFVILEEQEGVRCAKPIQAKSGSISQLMNADGYVRMTALQEGVKAGESVKIYLLNQ